MTEHDKQEMKSLIWEVLSAFFKDEESNPYEVKTIVPPIKENVGEPSPTSNTALTDAPVIASEYQPEDLATFSYPDSDKGNESEHAK